MIVCPNCQHKEYEGALFCSECGAQLASQDEISTHNLEDSTEHHLEDFVPEPVKQPPVTVEDVRVTLKFLDMDNSLPLIGEKEFTLGRATGEQTPDVDLTPLGGHMFGVSRMHAAINVKGDKVTIQDLGSTNGTRVNGRKLSPHSPYPLENGDVVSLGKLRIQLFVRQ